MVRSALNAQYVLDGPSSSLWAQREIHVKTREMCCLGISISRLSIHPASEALRTEKLQVHLVLPYLQPVTHKVCLRNLDGYPFCICRERVCLWENLKI